MPTMPYVSICVNPILRDDLKREKKIRILAGHILVNAAEAPWVGVFFSFELIRPTQGNPPSDPPADRLRIMAAVPSNGACCRFVPAAICGRHCS